MHSKKDILLEEKEKQIGFKDDLLENKGVEIKILKKQKTKNLFKGGLIGFAVGGIITGIILSK